MANNEETEVKEIEPTPIEKEEVVLEPEETAPGASQAETEEETSLEDDSTESSPKGKVDDVLAEVEGETPRERALRQTLTETRAKLRQERKEELFGNEPLSVVTPKKEVDPKEAEIYGRYKPEDIAALKEVFPLLAKEMGFVNKDELKGSTYAEKSQEVLDTFLEKHPEYLPENDKGGELWGAFKNEFQQYKTPPTPKDFAKLFEKVHRDVFGIKPGKGALPTLNAQREKVKTASHAGSSSNPPALRGRSGSKSNTAGLRLDALKGFTDAEKAEMLSNEDE